GDGLLEIVVRRQKGATIGLSQPGGLVAQGVGVLLRLLEIFVGFVDRLASRETYGFLQVLLAPPRMPIDECKRRIRSSIVGIETYRLLEIGDRFCVFVACRVDEVRPRLSDRAI